jgi:Ni,Fe-hydrogenase III small subunit
MPSTTTNRALPIPLDTDPFADGAKATRDLANALDTNFEAFLVTLVVAAGTTFQSKNIVFPVAFPAGTTPAVVCQVGSTAVTAGYFADAYSVTNTGCTIRVDKLVGAAPGSNVTVQVGVMVAKSQASL